MYTHSRVLAAKKKQGIKSVPKKQAVHPAAAAAAPPSGEVNEVHYITP